jgi:hypothetical protein
VVVQDVIDSIKLQITAIEEKDAELFEQASSQRTESGNKYSVLQDKKIQFQLVTII